MGIVREALDFIARLLTWWYLVMPWESAVRVRLGNRATLIGPGVHARIPYFDVIYVQNTRLRMMHLQTQTISTKDSKPLTLAGSIRYRIQDVLKLYQTLHQAEQTVKQCVAAVITEYIVSHELADISPDKLMAFVNERIALEEYGLAQVAFCLTDFCTVRTYRMISEGIGGYSATQLDTQSMAQGANKNGAPS